MDQGPLVSENIEAGARLAKEYQDRIKPLGAVFWAKDAEYGWNLYLVSEQVDDVTVYEAWAAAGRLVPEETEYWLSSDQVRVIPSQSKLGQEVIEYQRALKSRDHGKRLPYLNNLSILDGYLYPLPIKVPSLSWMARN